ncbi:MAG: phosphatidylglycerophosphatase A [Deltaproteobacteria bacterium]|nr:MAG: phosphatidylglycerophosphatase A [Deltaproteobacteria bacterium]
MRGKLIKLLASGFGLGLAPYIPGTVGTLSGIPFALILAALPKPIALLTVALLLPLGAHICGEGAKLDGKASDPGWVVFDELIGFLFATIFLTPTVFGYLTAFFLFRLFDIIKPPPVSWLDERVKGGWGILLDDVAAGIMARAALYLISLSGVL